MALPVTDTFGSGAGSLSNPPYTSFRSGETLRYDGIGNCIGQASGVYAPAYRNDNTFTNGQSIEVTLTAGIPAGGLVLYVNIQGTYGSEGGYDVYLDSGGSCGIERVVAGTPTEVASTTFSATIGDKFKISNNGSGVITVLKNGASMSLSYTDGSPLTGGAPGMGIYGDTGQTIKLNDATFDNVGGGVTNTKVVSESTTIIDAIVRSIIRGRLTLEATTVFEEGAFKSYSIVFDDVPEVADEAPRSAKRGRVVDENVSLTDAVIRYLFRKRFLDDAVTVTDQIIKIRRFVRLSEDALTAIDSIIKSVTGSGILNTKVVSEGVDVTDDMIRIRRVVRMVGETLTLIDSLIKSVSGAGFTYVTVVSESVTIVDENGRRAMLTRQFLESIGVSDQAQRQITKPRTTTDGVTLTDGFLSALRRVRDMFESVEISDGTAKVRWSRKFVDEMLGITDDRMAYYIPFLQYTYDVRVSIGIDNFILLGHDDFITLGGYQ